MNIEGTAREQDGEWLVEGKDGKTYQMVGGDFLARMNGKTVKVVGVEEDSFGDSFFGGTPKIIVQKVTVV